MSAAMQKKSASIGMLDDSIEQPPPEASIGEDPRSIILGGAVPTAWHGGTVSR